MPTFVQGFATLRTSSLIHSPFEAEITYRRLVARAASVRALPVPGWDLRLVSAGRFRLAASSGRRPQLSPTPACAISPHRSRNMAPAARARLLHDLTVAVRV